MLGAASGVFAVGELRELYEASDVRCRICARREGCSFWTPAFKDACRDHPDRAYDFVRERAREPFERRVVVHADKVPAIYRREAETNRFDGLIVLFKRPEAYVYSATRHSKLTVDAALAAYRKPYEDLLDWADTLPAIFVSYEAFAGDAATETARLCGALNVPYDDGMLRFWERRDRMHLLAGNAGAMSQLLREDQLAEAITRPFWQESYSPEQVAWVREHHRSIALDEKWRLLDEDDLARIAADERAQDLHRTLLARAGA